MSSYGSLERKRNVALGLAAGALFSVVGTAADAAVTIVNLDATANDWVTVDSSTVNSRLSRAITSVTGEFGGAVGTDKVDRMDFNMSTKINAPATDPFQSGVFYGGIAGVRFENTTTTTNDNWIRNGVFPAPDSQQLGIRSSTGSEHRFVSALLWKKADFLNGGATSQVDLDNNSVMTLNGRMINGTSGATVGRWLVETGGQLYISEATIAFTATSTAYSLDLSTTTTNWAAVNFGGGTNDNATGLLSALPTTFSALTPTDITAVGFYTEKNSATAVDVRFLFRSFAVSASVPEPASMALLGLSGAGLLIRRRKAS